MNYFYLQFCHLWAGAGGVIKEGCEFLPPWTEVKIPSNGNNTLHQTGSVCGIFLELGEGYCVRRAFS